MKHAEAEYERISKTEVMLLLTYPDGSFSVQRVTRPRGRHRYATLYDFAYAKAESAAKLRGYELGRFCLSPAAA